MNYPSLPMRGRREDRMLVAPVECVRKMTTGSTRATRPSLRDWFTAHTCSPRRAGLSSHRRLPGQRPCKLDPSVGGSGPHDFAVRFDRARQSQFQRPSPPVSMSVTTRPPLLAEPGWRTTNHIIPKIGRRIFSRERLDLGRRRF